MKMRLAQNLQASQEIFDGHSIFETMSPGHGDRRVMKQVVDAAAANFQSKAAAMRALVPACYKHSKMFSAISSAISGTGSSSGSNNSGSRYSS
jgi:hypothetical protein